VSWIKGNEGVENKGLRELSAMIPRQTDFDGTGGGTTEKKKAKHSALGEARPKLNEST